MFKLSEIVLLLFYLHLKIFKNNNDYLKDSLIIDNKKLNIVNSYYIIEIYSNSRVY